VNVDRGTGQARPRRATPPTRTTTTSGRARPTTSRRQAGTAFNGAQRHVDCLPKNGHRFSRSGRGGSHGDRKTNPMVHWEITVNDVGKAKAFYGRVFDWEFDDERHPGYTMIVTGKEPGGGMTS
jgi:hypothetical protein